MNEIRVLVACEFSGTVRDAFIARGADAMSCDLLPTEKPGPHYQGDVRDLLTPGRWDLLIAHPPCTHLSNAGAKHLFRGHKLNEKRYTLGLIDKDFFLTLFLQNINHIAVENPVSSRIYDMPKHSQDIQPWMFGHPTTKKTRLWLKNLPPLIPTDVVKPLNNCHDAGTWFMTGGKDRQKNRAKTFQGIAAAMAAQWMDYIKGATVRKSDAVSDKAQKMTCQMRQDVVC